MRIRLPLTAVIVPIVAILAAVPAASGTADSRLGGERPKLEQLTYEESNDGSSRRYNLSAYARRTDAVSFAVRKNRERLSAPGRFNRSVTDTDLPNGPVSHPWQILRREGGKQVLRQIRSSLNRDGESVVRVRLTGAAGVSKDRIVIDASDCGSDPPLYPLTCEIRR